jgi:hypothetical protein
MWNPAYVGFPDSRAEQGRHVFKTMITTIFVKTASTRRFSSSSRGSGRWRRLATIIIRKREVTGFARAENNRIIRGCAISLEHIVLTAPQTPLII